jgi:hypothetical protein
VSSVAVTTVGRSLRTADYYDTKLATRFGGQARFNDLEADSVEV